MQTHPTLSLITHFQDLPDPRVNRTKEHDLIDILVIAICTLPCGGESFNDMEDFGHARRDWFQTFLTLRNGIPSHDTFNRLLAGAKLSTGAATLAQWGTVEKDHGRIETRRYHQSAELAWFADREKWAGLQSVGRGEQTAPGARRVVSGGSKPGARGPRGGEPGHPAATGVESVETGENQKAGHQGQTTQRDPGSRLSAPPAGSANLDASALKAHPCVESISPVTKHHSCP